jgi:hypothetical protein
MMFPGIGFNADNGMITLLLVLCGTVIMVVLLRRHQFRKVSQRDVARDHIARVRDQHRLRESMDELLVQLEEVSRRVGAQVDTKFAKLEKVIRDADDRLVRLETALKPTSGKLAKPLIAMPSASTRRSTNASASATAVHDETETEGETPAEPRPSIEPDDARFKSVYELADAGATPIKIAEQLDLPLGEVVLILNLRKLR